MRKVIWLISVVCILITIYLYATKSAFWHNFGVVGIWLLFDNLAHLRKRKTTLDLIINKKYKKFFTFYFALLILAILIEVIGSLILKLWSYPILWSYEPLWLLVLVNAWGYLFYPFILMSLRETYNFFNSLIKIRIVDVIISMLLGILIWEVPNVFSQDWIYNIPYITLEIFHINIVVIVGWSILILSPIYIYNKLMK